VKRFVGHSLGYLWALPNTLLGVACVPFVLLSGGRVRFERGAMELYGGFAAWFLRKIAGGAGAMTLGHVILGRDRAMLEWTRNHEHVHVWQYMVWGPFFLPMYAISSFQCWRKGQNPYMDNRFEKVAYELHPCYGEPPTPDYRAPTAREQEQQQGMA
jgi:hypothetical protein